MNKPKKTKKPSSGSIIIHIVNLALIALALIPSAVRAEVATTNEIAAANALFLASGQATRVSDAESFVIPVSGAARIEEIRQYLDERAAGTERRRLVATCKVRLGTDGVNRNHSARGTPLWEWHVTELVSVRRAQPELEFYPAIPSVFAKPSEIKGLLENDPAALPDNTIALVEFPIVMELKTEAPHGTLANVSDRGWVGTGDNVKITGFIVHGGSPRNVVVRVLGPSLEAFGVKGVLSNPRLEIFRGTEKIAENDNWMDGNLNRPVIAVYPPPPPFHLVPHDPREPAIELTLEPGAYTMVISGVGGETGIVLAEVHTF